jgi:hypothetical protein
MREVGNADRQESGRGLNNRAENSHQPFRRRERAMQRFRSVKTLQKFSSVHAQVDVSDRAVNLNAQRPLREFQQTAGHPPLGCATGLTSKMRERDNADWTNQKAGCQILESADVQF